MLTTIFAPQDSPAQTISCLLVGPTSQIYLHTIAGDGAIVDTSDILDRYLRRKSESKEEEQIAAQLLKARQKRPELQKQRKTLTDWKKLIYKAIHGAQTLEELEAIEVPTIQTDSPEVVAAILAEIEERKAAKQAEIELRMAQTKLKMEEAALQSVKLESEISARLEQQRQAIAAIQTLQEQVMARHAVAMKIAEDLQNEAFAQLQQAEQKAQEFTRKRNNRIKRLKALMWLAKLDL